MTRSRLATAAYLRYINLVKKCQLCGKIGPTMFITQIVKGEMRELNICEECARKQGLIDPVALNFNEKFFPENFHNQLEALMHKVHDEIQAVQMHHTNNMIIADDKSISCPACKFSLSQFLRLGRLGCSDCYHAFAPFLKDKNSQNAEGGAPAHTKDKPMPTHLRIKYLEAQMAKLIQEEKYEEAARVRDEIKELQAQL